MSRTLPGAAALLAAALLAVLTLAGPAAAARRPAAPHLSSVSCLRTCVGTRTVQPGSQLRLRGRAFGRPLSAVFGTNAAGTRRVSAVVRVTTRTKASVVVPGRARTGVLYVRDRYGRRSNRMSRPLIVRVPVVAPTAPATTASGTAFEGNGMWIWYVSKAVGGDVAGIVAQARAHGITTVFIKSSDGTTPWAQFSPALVAALKAGGLRVCAWQYVYGVHPETEAARGAEAVQAGADCLVIDAETEYEGRYAQAQQYMTALRTAIGPTFPVGLSSFPYTDYHPALPYSVFFRPGGAQFNLPQIYWKAIGGGLDNVVAHSYRFNRPYGRPIVPIGQLYDAPSTADVLRFRQLVASAGSPGLSWWSWQHATGPNWDATGTPLSALVAPTVPADWATYAQGTKGDLVVWAQEHLAGAGQPIVATGTFDSATKRAVQAFQVASGLPVTGVLDTSTWTALDAVTPVPTDWTASATASASSTRLPAVRDELH